MIKKLGKIFGEELSKREKRSRVFYNQIQTEETYYDTYSLARTIFLSLLLIASFLFLGFKAFGLMIVNGSYNRERSDQNRIRLNIKSAPRGVIYDRRNIVLVRNIPQYKFKKEDGSENLISRDEALQIEAKAGKEAGLLKISPAREYIYGADLAHVLGYMSEVNAKELKNNEDSKKYNLGDRIGRLGLEEQYESILRGINGRELVEVDALGRTIKKIGEQPATAGVDIHLTLDLKLQKLIAENFPKNEKGAVVASDPNTGEILALYSSPSFDSTELQKLLSDKEAPLFNRAISGTYPSGSTFKMVTAATGLESGKINKDTEIEDVGEIVIGPFRFPNWYFLQYGGKEGMVNIVKAIKRSNDIFFYKVGEMVGIDRLAAMAKRFGLSQKLGIDLPGEVTGLIPDETWKQKVIGDNWYLGDTYHLAIGQGYLLVTPLQVNFMTDVMASGGKLCRPSLLLRPDLYALRSGLYREDCKDIGLKKETVDLIKQGMKEACLTGGTGWPFFEFSTFAKASSFAKASEDKQRMEVGCKTGTAEFGDAKNRTHAWFTVFAPWDKPKITLTVLVEGAGEGSNVAAPVAKKVLEQWLPNQ